MQECGVLFPLAQSAEETWAEALRVPAEIMGSVEGGKGREQAEKRKREESDVGDVRSFANYFDSEQAKEVKRVAGMAQTQEAATVGVGGGVVAAEDFLAGLVKRYAKGEESRLVGTVLGGERGEVRGVHIEGGPVGRLEE